MSVVYLCKDWILYMWEIDVQTSFNTHFTAIVYMRAEFCQIKVWNVAHFINYASLIFHTDWRVI